MLPAGRYQDYLERPLKRERWENLVDSSEGEQPGPLSPLSPFTPSPLVSLKSYDEPAPEMAAAATMQMQAFLSLGTPSVGSGSGSSSDFVTVPVEMPRAVAEHISRGGTMLCSGTGTDVLLARAESTEPCGNAGTSSTASRKFARKTRMRPRASATRELVRKRSRDAEPMQVRHQVRAPVREASVPARTTSRDPDEEATWARRISKRVRCVERIKASAEFKYPLVVERRRQLQRSSSDSGLEQSPRTPDPTDRKVSKRAWEEAIVGWKDALRQFNGARPEPEQL